MSLNGRLPLWLQVLGLHTLDGLFCFLGFRLDLCFEPLDFVLFREVRAVRRCEQRVTGRHGRRGRTREEKREEQEVKKSDTRVRVMGGKENSETGGGNKQESQMTMRWELWRRNIRIL